MWSTNHTKGYVLDPHNLEGSVAMPDETTAADLYKFNGAVNWIRAGIAPIHYSLTALKRLHDFRKSQLAKMALSPELWTSALLKTLDEVKKLFAARVKLTHLYLGFK